MAVKTKTLSKTTEPRRGSRETWTHNIKKYWPYYLMVLPGFLYFIVFKFIPMLGSIIAFQDFNIMGGMLKSPWVGLKHFKQLFTYSDFKRILTNTIFLGFCKTILIFPIPIILSLMLNEIQNLKLKKTIQTAVYIPYFISWVVVGGLIFDIFGIGGLFNNIRNALGMESVLVMQKESWFRPIYVISSIWKDAGWGTVVYLAAISGIDPSLYESAAMDGAGRFSRMRHITFPLLIPTIITLFLLNIGSFLDLGFDQVFNLQTPMTYNVSDIFDTYVYRVGIQQAQYSFTTAVGLFQSVVGLALVLIFNKISQKTEGGLW